MKRTILLFVGWVIALPLWAQTNTFPNSGNVGIGTTNPTATLEVVGNSYIHNYLNIGRARNTVNSYLGGLFINDTGETYTSIQLVDEGWSGSHALLFNAYKVASTLNGNISKTGNTKYIHNKGNYSSGAGMIAYYGNYGVMSFYISPASTGAGTNVEWGTAKLTIRRNGSVGIGTDIPTAKLAVNGDIKSKEVIVTEQSEDWPDYVFEAEYKLPDLSKLEAFIKVNKHLSNIPTKVQVEKDGQDLGAIQIKLLQKIEELTLHLIEHEKKIQALLRENQILKNEIKGNED